MTYTDEQIEEAARILAKKWGKSYSMYCKYAIDVIVMGKFDKFNSEQRRDITRALRQAVERKPHRV